MADLNLDGFYAKTDKGREEIAKRTHGLTQAMRAVLITLDGKTPLRELAERFASLPTFVRDLELLVEQGFIEEATPPPGAAAARAPSAPPPAITGDATADRLIDMAKRLLGKHADAVVARLEKAAGQPTELVAAVEGCTKLIKLTIDEHKAQQFRERGLSILGN